MTKKNYKKKYKTKKYKTNRINFKLINTKYNFCKSLKIYNLFTKFRSFTDYSINNTLILFEKLNTDNLESYLFNALINIFNLKQKSISIISNVNFKNNNLLKNIKISDKNLNSKDIIIIDLIYILKNIDNKNKIINYILDIWKYLKTNGLFILYISKNTLSNNSLISEYLIKNNKLINKILYVLNKLENSDFHGSISYAINNNSNDTYPLFIWYKLVNIKKQQIKYKDLLEKDYNPSVKIISELIEDPEDKNKKIKLNIIRDDLLEAGSKQRAMIPYLLKNKAKEFVYITPYTGSAQITLAYSSLYTGKRVSIFINDVEPMHDLTKKALSYGVVNLFKIPNGGFKKMDKYANNYVKWKKKEKGDNYIYLFNLGFNNKEYIDLLYSQLNKAIPDTVKKAIKRLWIPTGSSALINALYSVFPKDKYPKIQFLSVQIGKTVWDDMVDLSRTIIYRSEEFFYDIAKIQPPYPTTKSYDAKIWKFIIEYAENEDYVLNITKD